MDPAFASPLAPIARTRGVGSGAFKGPAMCLFPGRDYAQLGLRRDWGGANFGAMHIRSVVLFTQATQSEANIYLFWATWGRRRWLFLRPFWGLPMSGFLPLRGVRAGAERMRRFSAERERTVAGGDGEGQR